MRLARHPASIASIPEQGFPHGVYVDLDYTADAVGNMDGFQTDDDLIFNIENIIGSANADYIAGNAGVNVLRGGAGDDFLLSRGGNDRLFGGVGADSFIFENTAGGADLIRDFELDIDKIAIVSDNFSGINAGNIASRLTINGNGSVAGNSNAQFIFDNSGADAGRLLYDADGNGGGAAVLLATLTIVTLTDPVSNLPVFNADDFIFI